ncbi:MAG: type II toxin-antitoxin system ParD family antitoxin [Gammaproteobacteria bacterium]|nr:type II toxin-antitoxin system ParD family antitoxin [Gammaproteobacteria bacterium]
MDDQVSVQGHSTASESGCDRFFNDRERLRELLLEGAASPQASIADAGFYNTLRDRVCDAGPR